MLFRRAVTLRSLALALPKKAAADRSFRVTLRPFRAGAKAPDAPAAAAEKAENKNKVDGRKEREDKLRNVSQEVASSRSLRARLDAVLTMVERPARDGFAFAKEALVISATLVAALTQLLGEAYRDYVHFRLRRLLRFAIGTPFLFSLVYLLTMRYKYLPEGPRRLQTDCVAGLPMCHTAEDLVGLAYQTRKAYRAAQHRAVVRARRGKAAKPGQPQKNAAGSMGLTPQEQNAAARGLFVLLRSIETVIMGTPEERALIEPRHDLLGPETTPRTTSVGGVAAPSTLMANTRPASPAEFVLRIVLSISLEQGWFDIAEAARGLYDELVKNAPTPTQARVVSAVGDLCSLSYELEHFSRDSQLTLNQRRRFARAIDAFRPERAVEERSTIASEISVLPLSDVDNSTRCLGMIRHSQGRKPQLVLCFIGSNSLQNWITNFNFFPTTLPAYYGVGSGARVHRGFLHLLESINYVPMAEGFDEVILIGHSLGSSLAFLAGLRLAAERPSRRITVITMASPRVLAIDKNALATAPVTDVLTSPVTTSAAEEAVVQPAVILRDSGKKDTGNTKGPGAASTSTPHVHMHYDEDIIGTERAAAAALMPRNYRHFRGYIRADVVARLPPERLFGYTHVGGRIPLNTGCTGTLSFLGWGFWSSLFHSSELYSFILRDPPVAQTHYYTPTAEERQIQNIFSDDVYTHPTFA